MKTYLISWSFGSTPCQLYEVEGYNEQDAISKYIRGVLGTLQHNQWISCKQV